VDSKTASFNGAGNGYPVVGTGHSFYLQSGFTLPYFNQQKKKARLMPALGFQYSRFERLSEPMISYDLGIDPVAKRPRLEICIQCPKQACIYRSG
jgi:hypothetical protein